MKRWPAVLVHSICIASLALGAYHVQTATAQEKKAEEVYKNIKEMKGEKASEVIPAMHAISAALNVRCDFCHVQGANGEFDWASDQKQEKEVARHMIVMMRKINADNFGGQLEVTCATCHQGHAHPSPAPPLAGVLPAGIVTATFEGDTGITRDKDLPKVDDVLAKYTEALGGQSAIDKLKTLSSKATQISGAQAVKLESYAAAPDKTLLIQSSPTSSITQGFDGTVGWFTRDGQTQELKGDQLAGLKENADFYSDYKLKPQFKSLNVRGKTKIGQKDAIVLTGTALDGKSRQRLYFDAKTGLLLRRYIGQMSIYGDVPEMYDYEDYRTVAGVKMPFLLKHTTVRSTFLVKYDEIKGNVDIPASKFSKPPQSH